MLTQAEIGWLAGIIDGEGCIRAYWSARGAPVGGSLCISVQIEACSSAMVERVADLLRKAGIGFYLSNLKPRKGWSPSRQVLLKKKQEVLRLLLLLRDHLVVKKREAEIAIDFYSRWGDQRNPTSRAPAAEKIAIFDEMKRLKKVALYPSAVNAEMPTPSRSAYVRREP